MTIPTDKTELARRLALYSITERDRSYLRAAKELDRAEVARLEKRWNFNFGRGKKDKEDYTHAMIEMANLIFDGESKRAAAKAVINWDKNLASPDNAIRGMEQKFSKNAERYVRSAAEMRALDYTETIDVVDLSGEKILSLQYAFEAEAIKRYREKYEP